MANAVPLTSETCAAAASAQGLAALVLAGPPVEAEIDTLHFQIEQLHIELALGHAARAARARVAR